MKIRLSLIFILCAGVALGQVPVGQWRDHLSYSKTIDVCTDGQLIYCATPFGLFSLDPSDQSIGRITKVNVLSDVSVSAIEYDPSTKTIVVGYENGNLDLVRNGVAYNLSDIKRSSLVGDKEIYHILPYGEKVYLATGFGIVVIDIPGKEVSGTYFIADQGEQLRINDLDIVNGQIYASTPMGIRVAPINDPFLANFQAWSWLTDVPATVGNMLDIEFFNDVPFINIINDSVNELWFKNPSNSTWEIIKDDTVQVVNDLQASGGYLVIAGYGSVEALDAGFQPVLQHLYHKGEFINSPSALVLGSDLWFANFTLGLCRHTFNNFDYSFMPDGPANGSVRRIASYNNNFWVAPGGSDASWTNLYNLSPISSMVNEKWKSIQPGDGTNTGLSGTRDLMDVAIDPENQSHVFLASWEEGLVEINNGEIINIYNEHSDNSSLQQSDFDFFPDWCGVAGVEFDPDGVLWCTNSWTTSVVHARKRNGQFVPFDFSPLVIYTDKIGDILPTRRGLIWTIVAGKGVVVLNTNGTLDNDNDDDFKLLSDDEGNGGLPTSDVLCIEEDLDNEIWVGTVQGIAVFYNPDCIFSEEPCDAEQILIEQDGNIQILLETEAVSVIRIDGGNRKWVGTQNSGVFLFSADGLNQIFHFNEENSPLLSNSILDISINHETGEVFFATEKGIVSFLGTATNFDQEIENVKVYPNPVKKDFSGYITIDGLAYDSDIKITDPSGNIVFTTSSEGGRAIWNGKTLNGEDAVNGMYLVFATRKDGQASSVAKIALLR